MGNLRGWLGSGLLAGVGLGMLLAKRERDREQLAATNCATRVLVLGAGVVGCTYAEHLSRWGYGVTLLDRGTRLEYIRQNGVSLQSLLGWRERQARAKVSDRVVGYEDYDLVVLAVRCDQLREALGSVAPLVGKTPLLLLQHNPDVGKLLGPMRTSSEVVLGYPSTVGYIKRGVVYSLPPSLAPTVLGNVTGARTSALAQVTRLLRRAGLKTRLQRGMPDWLCLRAAEQAVMAGAVRANGGSITRLVTSQVEVGRYREALREAHAVLEAGGVKVASEAEAIRGLEPDRPGLGILFRAALERFIEAASEEMAVLYGYLVARAEQSGLDYPLLLSYAESFKKREG